MNILQFFHKREDLPMFNVGDSVKLKELPEDIRALYNKHYPSCFLTPHLYIHLIIWSKAWHLTNAHPAFLSPFLSSTFYYILLLVTTL